MPKILERPLPEAIVTGRLISVKEAMAYLGISRRTLYVMTFLHKADERIPSYKYGKSRKYKFDELNWWLEKHREPI